jgi:hypothetical protein
MVAAVLIAGSGLVAQTPVHLSVDMRTAGTASRPRDVDNDTLVVVDIQKTTFQACTVDVKTEPIAPPANPIGLALAALNPFVGGAPTVAEHHPTPPSDDIGLDTEVNALVADATAALEDVQVQRRDTRAALLAVPGRLACTNGTDNPCNNPMQAAARLKALREDLGRLLDAPEVPVAGLNARLMPLQKALDDKIGSAKGDEALWLSDALARLDKAQRTIDAITDRRQAIDKSKAALAPLVERLETFVPATQQSVPLAVARDAKTTLTIKCLDAITQEQQVYAKQGSDVQRLDIPALTTTVTYTNVPWASVTAGALYSTLDKRQVGVSTVKTGTDDTGTVTFQRQVAVTDHAKTQVMPFTFLNIAVYRSRLWTPALVAGFGLNPNNGGKVLEYFLGAGLIVHKEVAIEIGAHLGSLQQAANGFAEGDVLPDKVTTVPTSRQRKNRLAIGLTYRLPLPK